MAVISPYSCSCVVHPALIMVILWGVLVNWGVFIFILIVWSVKGLVDVQRDSVVL